jgi:hypothetical protein
MNEINKWIGKRVNLVVKGLYDKPTIYTAADVISIDNTFITLIDNKTKEKVSININNIILIEEAE